MTTPARVLEITSGRFRRRPLLRRFREQARVFPREGGGTIELRIDFGGLGFLCSGSLMIPERWEDELASMHIDRFLHDLEEGFVTGFDKHLAKQEAA